MCFNPFLEDDLISPLKLPAWRDGPGFAMRVERHFIMGRFYKE